MVTFLVFNQYLGDVEAIRNDKGFCMPKDALAGQYHPPSLPPPPSSSPLLAAILSTVCDQVGGILSGAVYPLADRNTAFFLESATLLYRQATDHT